MNRTRVLSSAIVYTIGGGLPMLGSLVLLPFYTSAFTTAQFGELSLLIGLTLLFQNIVSFSLDSFLAVHYHHHEATSGGRRNLVASVFVLELILGFGFLLIMMLVGTPLFHSIFGDGQVDFWRSGMMCVITAISTACIRSYFNLLIVEKSAVRYLLWNFGFAVVGVVLSLYFLFRMPTDVNGPLIGRLLTGLGFMIVIYVLELKVPRVFDVKVMKGWLNFCGPIVVMTLSAWALTYVNPYILNEIIDADGVGIYTFLLSLMFAIEFVQTGLASPLNARIYEARSQAGSNHSEERSIHQVYSMLNIIAIAGAVAILPVLAYFITDNEDYLNSLFLVPLFAAGYSWRGVYNMAFTVAMFEKRTNAIMINSIVSSLCQVLLTLVLAWKMGLQGAVISFALARMMQAIMMEWRVKAQDMIDINIWKMNIVPAIFTALLVVDFLILCNYPNWWTSAILFILTIGVFMVWYRRDLVGIIRKYWNLLLKRNPPPVSGNI